MDGEAFTFSASDFDLIGVADDLCELQVTGLERRGSLEFDGQRVMLNQVVSRTDIDGGKLQFRTGPDPISAGKIERHSADKKPGISSGLVENPG